MPYPAADVIFAMHDYAAHAPRDTAGKTDYAWEQVWSQEGVTNSAATQTHCTRENALEQGGRRGATGGTYIIREGLPNGAK